MKITSTLALKFIKKNKKRSSYTIFGIIIVTVLVTTIITLISSYQQYLIAGVKSKGNWEAEFKNITYSDSQKIKQNENIKEISISHKIGTSEENFGIGKLNVVEVDDNTLKNINLSITEGRLPENPNEIIISEASDFDIKGHSNIKEKIGDNITITVNGKAKNYTLVGKIQKSKFDEKSFVETKHGAITILNEKELNNDSIVNVSILTNNIQKIYTTGNELVKEIGISLDKKEETRTEEEIFNDIIKGVNLTSNIASIEYNTELLNYEGVINLENEFSIKTITIGTILIIILMTVSIIMLKASFSMTYNERIRELGMLTSVGMNKKQRKHVMSFEKNILGIIGIIIGFVLGIALSYVGIEVIKNIIARMNSNEIFTLYEGIELSLKVPISAIIIIVIIIWIIIDLSSNLPMRRLNKISSIEAIKNNKNIKLKNKQFKTPKLIEKLFKEEGILSYKNIRKDKSKYKTVVISLLISFILFLSITGLVEDIDKYIYSARNTEYDDYTIEITPVSANGGKINIEKINEIMQYLEDNKLVDECYANLQPFNVTTIELKENEVSETVKEMIKEGKANAFINENENIEIEIGYLWIIGDAYEEILKKAGLTELKDNEVIIANSITEKTKYGDKIQLTNLKIGDSYKIDIGSTMKVDNMGEETFTIAGIVDDFSPYITNKLANGTRIIQVMSPEYVMKLIDKYDYIYFAQINIRTDEKRATKIDECMNEIKKIYGETEAVVGNNKLPMDFSKYEESISPEETTTRIDTSKVSAMSVMKLLRVLLYSFVVVVAIIASINIFNAIYASIILRKKEFAMLKSIGMSNKQVNKMLLLEGLFYGMEAIILGSIISIVILYVMHTIILGNAYLFKINLINILISIAIMYAIIFLTITYSKRKLKKNNIIDEIREENI